MYVVDDLAHLPIIDNSVDATVYFHVVHHIAEELQSVVFKEISRALKHDGTAAIVYRRACSPSSWRLDRMFTRLAILIPRNAQHSSPIRDEVSPGPALNFLPHLLEYFNSQPCPLKAKIFSLRVIDNEFIREHFANHRMWRHVTNLLSMWQRLMRRFTGADGAYPCIVIKGRRHEQ